MITLEHRSEQLKLARTLGVEPEELRFLLDAPVDDLRVLRERIADELFDADRRHFEGMVKLASRLPAKINAQLALHALGPQLGARAAGLLEPAMAADLAGRLPAHFLAELAVAADARKLAHLLDAVPDATVADIAAELATQEEWIVMGAFVSHMPESALDAAIERLDSEALLRTGFVLDDKRRVDKVVRRLDDERLVDYLRTALKRNLLPEALDLGQHLTKAGRKRLGKALNSLDDAELDAFAAKVSEEDVLRAAAEPLLAEAPARVRDRL